MDKSLFFPKKLMDDELFKEFLETSYEFSEPYQGTFKDISEKYFGSQDLPQEAIDQILKEFGLESLSTLLGVSPVIDSHNVLGFANAIAALKGSDVGYFLVLDLLNFSYIAIPWHEQSPRGQFNTFSLDVNLDASVIAEPYKTFQGIKRFTRDYLLSIISPLGYTYFVPFTGPAIALKAAAHQIVTTDMQRIVDPALVYGNSGWIVEDENNQKWKIKVNGVGQLKAFKSNDPRNPTANYMTDGLDSHRIIVSTAGVLSTVLEEGPNQKLQNVLLDTNENEWTVTVDGSGDLIVS